MYDFTLLSAMSIFWITVFSGLSIAFLVLYIYQKVRAIKLERENVKLKKLLRENKIAYDKIENYGAKTTAHKVSKTSHKTKKVTPAWTKNEIFEITLWILTAFIIIGVSGLLNLLTDPKMKFGILFAVMIFFSAAGVGMYCGSKNSKPMAVSFVTIGLAMLPLIGISMRYNMEFDAIGSWVIVSFLAVLLSGSSYYIIRSRFISLLFIFSLMSFVLSSSVITTGEIFWGLVVLVILSSFSQYFLLKYQNEVKPFVKFPLSSGAIASLVVLLMGASLIYSGDIYGFLVLSGLVFVQYFLSWLFSKRYLFLCIARIVISIFVIGLGLYLADGRSESVQIIATSVVISALVQQIMSIKLLPIVKRKLYKKDTELAALYVSFAMQWASVLMMLSDHAYHLSAAIILVVLSALSFIYYKVLKHPYWNLGILAALVLLPMTVKGVYFGEYEIQLSFAVCLYIIFSGFGMLISLSKKTRVTNQFLLKLFSFVCAALAIFFSWVATEHIGSTSVFRYEYIFSVFFMGLILFISYWSQRHKILQYLVLSVWFAVILLSNIIMAFANISDPTLSLPISALIMAVVSIMWAEYYRQERRRIVESNFRITALLTLFIGLVAAIIGSNSVVGFDRAVVLALGMANSGLVSIISFVQFWRTASKLSIVSAVISVLVSATMFVLLALN